MAMLQVRLAEVALSWHHNKSLLQIATISHPGQHVLFCIPHHPRSSPPPLYTTDPHKMARACLEDSACIRDTPQLDRTIERRTVEAATLPCVAAGGNDSSEGWPAWWEVDEQELARAPMLPQLRLTAPAAATCPAAASEPHLSPQWTTSPPRLAPQRSGSIASCLQRQWSMPLIKVEQQPESPVGVLMETAKLQPPLTPRSALLKIQPFRLRCVCVGHGFSGTKV